MGNCVDKERKRAGFEIVTRTLPATSDWSKIVCLLTVPVQHVLLLLLIPTTHPGFVLLVVPPPAS